MIIIIASRYVAAAGTHIGQLPGNYVAFRIHLMHGIYYVRYSLGFWHSNK